MRFPARERRVDVASGSALQDHRVLRQRNEKTLLLGVVELLVLLQELAAVFPFFPPRRLC